MVRRLGPALAALTLVLAGCGEPAVVRPSADAGPWRPEAAGGSWVVMSHGCGFCSGSLDVPEFTLVAVDEAGHVLRVRYGHDDGAEGVAFADERLAEWRPVLEPLFLQGRPYALTDGLGDQRPARIHGVTALALTDGDWRDVRAVLNDGLGRGGASHGEIDVTDCGPRILEGPASPARVQSGCGLVAAPGWDLVLRQMRALDGWATA